MNGINTDDSVRSLRESREETKQLLEDALNAENLVVTQPLEKGSEHHRKVDKGLFMDKVYRAQKNAEVQNLLHDLTWEDRYEWMNHRKLKGNRYFKQRKFVEAQEIYLEAMLGITKTGHSKEKLQRMEREMSIPILTNIAQCLIAQQKSENAIVICNKVLEMDKNNVKALCKRGTAYKFTRNYDAARKDYQTAHRISKVNHDSQSMKDISNLYDKLLEVENKEKRAFSKMFENGSTEPTQVDTSGVNNLEAEDQLHEHDLPRREIDERHSKHKGGKEIDQILHYNDDMEKLRNYGVFRFPLYPFYKFFKLVKNTCSARNGDSDDENYKDDEEDNKR